MNPTQMTPTMPSQGTPRPPVRLQLDGFWYRPDRRLTAFAAIGVSLLFIGAASLIPEGRLTVLLFDRPSLHFPYPLTIQNIMHVVFFLGLGELFVRWRAGAREEALLKAGFLPEDEHTVLTPKDLGPIRRRVMGQFDRDSGFVASLINLSILQFQSSRSVEQASGVMTSSLELLAHRVDLQYGLVRFVAWLVPTLGFIGTVFGLGASLAQAGDPAKELDLKEMAKTLAVGFDCTMVALSQSALLVFLLQLVQEQEERAVNLAGDYTLRNLINRLYVGN